MSLLCYFTNHDYLVCETVVLKRIFADKRARENSSLNRDGVNPKTLKSHANGGYFIIIMFFNLTNTLPTNYICHLFRTDGLCYHI